MLGLYVIYNDKALQHHKSMKMEDKVKKIELYSKNHLLRDQKRNLRNNFCS